MFWNASSTNNNSINFLVFFNATYSIDMYGSTAGNKEKPVNSQGITEVVLLCACASLRTLVSLGYRLWHHSLTHLIRIRWRFTPVVPKIIRSTAPLVPYTQPTAPPTFFKKHKCAFVSTFILYLKNRLNKIIRVKLNVLCVN